MSAQGPEHARAWEDVAPSAEAAEFAYGQSGDHTADGSDYYGNSQGYGPDDVGPPGAEAMGWHRNAAVLMGFGAFATVTIGFIIYGLVVLLGGGQAGAPADRTSLPPPTSSAVPKPTPVTTDSEVSSSAPVPTSPSVSASIPTTTVAAPSSTSPATTLVATTEASVPDTTSVPSTQSSPTATTSSESSSRPLGPPPPQGPVGPLPPQPRLGP